MPQRVLTDQEAKGIGALDPNKIYVENVRSLLGVSTDSAAEICEAAVRQGLFRRGVEVLCPDGAVAASAESVERLPATVLCWIETDGHPEEVELPTAKLSKLTFYSLNERSSPVLY